ncbi:MAG: hypothetical protein KKC84_01400, partial [Candidatus Omnitrophica bacterium]|nr:hypothetical protein [Candidatus Omnitrophota bacterium]
KDIGTSFWSPAFFEVTGMLKENSLLEIEITNTFANAIQGMPDNLNGVPSSLKDRYARWRVFKKDELSYGLSTAPKLLFFRE